ncbi:MAG: hypothetical protein XXXJIFNMEKO3_02120 [Candidatus Erwinia impunctatus]|nr:hypothetical protein XXXJIFNMEKO_02120 [Culicoides impunctatus]
MLKNTWFIAGLMMISHPCIAESQQSEVTTESDDFTFAPELFRGGNISVSALSKLAAGNIVQPGNYNVDVYVNNQFVQRGDVRFIELKGNAQPCFSEDLLTQAGLYDSKKNIPLTT